MLCWEIQLPDFFVVAISELQLPRLSPLRMKQHVGGFDNIFNGSVLVIWILDIEQKFRSQPGTRRV
jgi:hypothetical protein